LPVNELVVKLKDKMTDFKKLLPIIIAIRNPNLRQRHYTQLKLMIGYDLTDQQLRWPMSVLLNADVNLISLHNFILCLLLIIINYQ
jgi:hypothetical protein